MAPVSLDLREQDPRGARFDAIAQSVLFALVGCIVGLVAAGLLVDQTDELSSSDFRAGFISPDTMRLGLALPLHEGAERFFASRKEAAGSATDD